MLNLPAGMTTIKGQVEQSRKYLLFLCVFVDLDVLPVLALLTACALFAACAGFGNHIKQNATTKIVDSMRMEACLVISLLIDSSLAACELKSELEGSASCFILNAMQCRANPLAL